MIDFKTSTQSENKKAENSNNGIEMEEVNTEKNPIEQANAQLTTAEGEVGQQTNEAADPSFVATLLTPIGDKLPIKVKYVIMYSAAKAAGFKAVFLKGNRKVYDSQLNTLWKSAKEKKVFAEGCYVIPLRPILEKFPNIEAFDLEGNLVTLDSPDVDMCLVVYDGQHRITVCELHPGDIDVQLELNDFDGTDPLERIKSMNSFSKNWSGTDLRHSNVGAGITTNKLYEEAEKLLELYGITPKLSEYVLTFKREATQKKDLVEGKDTTVYVDENAQRGLGIYNAAVTCFNGAKEIKKIEFLDAVVFAYDRVKDTDKPSFARNMKLYLGTMSEKKRDEVKKLITDKDFGTLKLVINKGYAEFCDAGHIEETLVKMEADVDKAIADFIHDLQKKNQDKAAKKPLKSGRVHEVIKHNKTVEAAIEAEKLAKAKEKAKKAQKKAKEAQAVVDSLKKEENAD